MSKLLIGLMMVLSTSAFSSEDKETSKLIDELLSTGKLHGLCGSLYQQNIFQKSTKMQGGDEFMQRFWTAEAARLGMTIKEFVESCDFISKKYNKFYSK